MVNSYRPASGWAAKATAEMLRRGQLLPVALNSVKVKRSTESTADHLTAIKKTASKQSTAAHNLSQDRRAPAFCHMFRMFCGVSSAIAWESKSCAGL